MTDEQLAVIRARCEAATPGPWKTGRDADLMRPMQSFNVGMTRKAFDESPFDSWGQWEANCIFIENARADIPAMLAEIERLRRELAEIKANPFKPIQEMGYHDVDQYYVDDDPSG